MHKAGDEWGGWGCTRSETGHLLYVLTLVGLVLEAHFVVRHLSTNN